MGLRTKKTSSELEKYKKSHPKTAAESRRLWTLLLQQLPSKEVIFLSSYCCFLFSLRGMAVLLRRNEREWKNKEKNKKQIQIQFFKDIVNSRYEINYHAAQPRYFVV